MLRLALALAQAVAPAAPSLQAQFDQANAAIAAKQWQQALDGFAAIEARAGLTPRSLGLARLRKGFALAGLGQKDAAAEAFASGVALTSRDDSALTEYRVLAESAAGQLAQDHYDYVAARRWFEAALAESPDASHGLGASLDLIEVTMFDDPALALAQADKALKIAIDNNATPDIEAKVHDMRGRVLLNRGDMAGALAELKLALKQQGGITAKTDISDVVVRSDLAIAYILAKQEGSARELMAMTGAGRAPNNMFAHAAQMDLPACGDDLRPSDVAVIEFSVQDDGSVRYAEPVYASRPGMAVLDLARAVHGWAWRAEDLAKVPRFYRTATRVEVRCSTAAERPPAVALLSGTIAQWLGALDMPLGQPNRVSLGALQAAIARESGPGGKPRVLIRLLLELGSHRAADYATRGDAFDRALVSARAEQAPPAVIAWLRVAQASVAGRAHRGRTDVVASLLHDAETPEMAGDARAHAALVLDAVDEARSRTSPAIVGAIERVANDARLDPADPLRVGALLRLSSLQARAGDLEAARKSYFSTGLSAQQCALVDAKPALRGGGPGSSDFPQDALRWGVSGWTRVEFDVLPDGRTTNRRPVVSYPPFTFSDAATNGMRSATFTQSYRPQGGLGCGGAARSVNFVAHP